MKWIQRLETELEKLQAPTVAELRSALSAAGCTKEDIAPYVTEPADGRAYGRNVLYRSEHVEAVAIHLPPGTATAVHDHGDSIGCAAILEGSLRNDIYRKTDYGMAVDAGAVTVMSGRHLVAPHGQVHRMRNDNSERMVSLHLYAPPLAGVRCYMPEDDALLDYVI